MPARLSRRSLLAALAAAPLGAVPLTLQRQAQARGLITGAVCRVQPEASAGPFYVDPGLVRRDTTEDRLGTPMSLRLQVVQADCAPITGARVDVWQCDSKGVYSGVRSGLADARGQSFLRGTQMTDAQGVAGFDTIFPGWYPGRTPHIHYKVFLSGRAELTGQLYFPDAVTAQVYRAPAYRGRGPADTVNGADFLYRRAGEVAVAEVTGTTAQLDAALVVGVRV